MAFRHLVTFLIHLGLERNCWRSRLLSPVAASVWALSQNWRRA